MRTPTPPCEHPPIQPNPTNLPTHKKINQHTQPKQVLEKHKVDAATGLSSEEVRARQRIHGPNEMEEGEQETLLQKVRACVGVVCVL